VTPRIDCLTDDEIRDLPGVVIGYGDRCQVCGSTQYLQRAHLRAVGMGGKRAKQGPRIVACFDCHVSKSHDQGYRYRFEVTRDGEVLWCDWDEITVVGHIAVEEEL